MRAHCIGAFQSGIWCFARLPVAVFLRDQGSYKYWEIKGCFLRGSVSDCSCGLLLLFVAVGLTTLLLIILIDRTVGFDLDLDLDLDGLLSGMVN